MKFFFFQLTSSALHYGYLGKTLSGMEAGLVFLS